MLEKVAVILIYIIINVINADNTGYRSWMTGYWQGNPLFSPIGAFDNYTILFRDHNGNYTDNVVFLETGLQTFDNSLIPYSYQQWWINRDWITYCGLLTFDGGNSYGLTRPEFEYVPSESSEYQVVFCGAKKAGGCDTFKWVWKYDTTVTPNTLHWFNEVGGYPHESTLFNRIDDSEIAPYNATLRDTCKYIIGNQNELNYDWIQPTNITYQKMDNNYRSKFQKYIQSHK